jgi:predicted DNA-binding transcriptional regulator AlpA
MDQNWLRLMAPALSLNQKDAAAALGYSVPHFTEHVRPDLKKVYTGAAVRFPVSELQRWLERNAC